MADQVRRPPPSVACSFLSPSYTLTIIPHNNFTAYQMEKRIFLLATVAPIALAQLPSFAPAPGQPMHRGDPGTFEIIPDTLISSQQVYFDLAVLSGLLKTFVEIFLGRPGKVYILDKVQNNPTKINGHPAWAEGAWSSFWNPKTH